MADAYFVYQNERGQEIEFSARSPYLPTEVDGIFGLPAEIAAYASYLQDGENVVSTRIPARPISIAARIMRNVVKNRIRLLEVINPKLGGTLTLIRGTFVRRMACVVEQAPQFAITRGDMFTFALKAPDPFWHAEKETRRTLAAWEPMFEWELDVPPPPGLVFAEKSASLISNVVNDGEVPVGFRAVFTFTGTVEKPYLARVRTFEVMRVLLTLQPGDVMTITTGWGNKSATLIRAGEATAKNIVNDLDVVDPKFDFLTLWPGENLIRHDAAGGAEHMTIDLYYAPGYLGV